ncbi:hypothetical protein [Pseudoduganella sp. OTU4001]|uniref:hypothetical protein n=1 Tax=Pseudoduganella sp. OTU4001 TaxID=3043854 RepID=UPI00406C54F9
MENGLGVDQDYAKAIKLYKLAAETEEAIAFFSFAHLFGNGKGVRQDLRLAYIYSQIAVRYGSKRAGEYRDALAGQLTAEVRKEADVFAAAWTVKQPLPGISEASASPVGRE